MTSSLPTRLDDNATTRALSLSLGEGQLFALMVGLGDTYVVANAVALDATPHELAALLAVPLMVGALGPVAVLARMRRGRPRRSMVVAGAVLQGLAMLVTAAGNGGAWLGVTDLIALYALFQIGGQAAGTAWSSWYGDVVPAATRGRYFARRGRLIQISTFVGLVAGGVLLAWLERFQLGLGFAAVMALAGLCRLGSAALLWASPEPRAGEVAGLGSTGRFLSTGRGRSVVRLLVGVVLFQGAVYVSGPFFAPFQLAELQIGYAGYVLAQAAQAAGKFTTMPAWGRLVDRAGPRRAHNLTVFLAAAVPVPWLFVDGPVGAVLAMLLSGVAWGGYEIALLSVLLHATRRAVRPQAFAVQQLFQSAGQCAGSLAGAEVMQAGGYAAVFGFSSALRTVVAVGLVWSLRHAHALARPRLPLELRMVGYRPGPGVVHRPVLEPEAGTRRRRRRDAGRPMASTPR